MYINILNLNLFIFRIVFKINNCSLKTKFCPRTPSCIESALASQDAHFLLPWIQQFLQHLKRDPSATHKII